MWEKNMSFWKKKDNLIISGFVVLFFVGLAVWYDFCCVRAAFFKPNPPSSAFSMPFLNQEGKQVTLDQFKGAPLVINFWATWCPVCVKKMSTLNSFSQKFKDQGGNVLAISQDQGGLPTVRAYYARKGYANLSIYIEATGSLASAFGEQGLPTSIFIDAQGKEVGRIVGGIDWENPQTVAMVEKYFGMKLSQ
jgi:thiol-disulfide isomerase/thioredoxin